MSTLTVDVDDRVATALCKLNEGLAADSTSLEGVLRFNLDRAAERLGLIAEGFDPVEDSLAELRELADRVDAIVSVYEATTTADREQSESVA